MFNSKVFRYFVVLAICFISCNQSVLAAAPPPAPVGVTVAASGGQNTINWIPVQGAASYNIYWSTASKFDIQNASVVTHIISPPFIHNRDISSDQIYYYKVTALNEYGESIPSAQVKTTSTVFVVNTSLVVPSLMDKSSVHNRAYVTNNKDNNISIIDLDTDKVIGKISVGANPGGIDFNFVNNRLYVVNNGDNNISVIDVLKNNIVSIIPIGMPGVFININTATNRGYVTSYTNDALVIIDTSANKMLGKLDIGPKPIGVTVDMDSNKIYTTDWLSDVYMFDGNTNNFMGKLIAGARTYYVAIHPTKHNIIYVTNIDGGNVSVLNVETNTVLASINVGNRPAVIKINPANNKAYVANSVSNDVSVINILTNTLESTIPVGNTPQGVAINSNTNKVYVINTTSNSISVINGNTNKVVNTIYDVGSHPYDIVIIP